MAKAPFTRIYPVTAVDQDMTSELVYGDLVVMTVTDRNARPNPVTAVEGEYPLPARRVHAGAFGETRPS